MVSSKDAPAHLGDGAGGPSRRDRSRSLELRDRRRACAGGDRNRSGADDSGGRSGPGPVGRDFRMDTVGPIRFAAQALPSRGAVQRPRPGGLTPATPAGGGPPGGPVPTRPPLRGAVRPSEPCRRRHGGPSPLDAGGAERGQWRMAGSKESRWSAMFHGAKRHGVCERCGSTEAVHERLCRHCRAELRGPGMPLTPEHGEPSRSQAARRRPLLHRRGA